MQSKKVIWVILSLLLAIGVGYLVGSKRISRPENSPQQVVTYRVQADRADDVRESLVA